jgi:micrococcal nuclease
MKKVSTTKLRKFGVPAVLIPGLVLASVLGWTGWTKLENYRQSKMVFPDSGMVKQVFDGDTFELNSGVVVRLVGIDAPANDSASTNFLKSSILNRKVWLEYDRYQDDKYGRILAWVWINCESNPKFLPADYMHLTYNSSREGLTDNPTGCKQGKLVQEELTKKNLVSTVKYKDRGELKYEKRLEK